MKNYDCYTVVNQQVFLLLAVMSTLRMCTRSSSSAHRTCIYRSTLSISDSTGLHMSYGLLQHPHLGGFSSPKKWLFNCYK